MAIGVGSDRRSVGNEHAALNGAAWLSRHERPVPGAPGPPRGPSSESCTLDERTMRPAALAVGESARPTPVRGAGQVRRLDSISEEERADVGASPSGATTKRESGDPGLAAHEPSVNWAVGEEEERSMGTAATAGMSRGGASAPPDSPRGGATATIGTAALSRFSEDIARTVTEQGTAAAHSLLNARCPPAAAAMEYSHGGNKAGGHEGVDSGISRAGGAMEEEATEAVMERARPPEKSAGPRGTRSKRRRRTAPPATAAGPPTSPAGFRIAQMAPCVCAEAELHLKAGHEIASACEEISRAMERCSRPTAPAASTPPGDDRPLPLELPRRQGRGLGEDEAEPEERATVPGRDGSPVRSRTEVGAWQDADDDGAVGAPAWAKDSGGAGRGQEGSSKERASEGQGEEKAAAAWCGSGGTPREDERGCVEQTALAVRLTPRTTMTAVHPGENGCPVPLGRPGGQGETSTQAAGMHGGAQRAAHEAISRAAHLSGLCGDIAKQLQHQQQNQQLNQQQQHQQQQHQLLNQQQELQQQQQQQQQQHQRNAPECAARATSDSAEGQGGSARGPDPAAGRKRGTDGVVGAANRPGEREGKVLNARAISEVGQVEENDRKGLAGTGGRDGGTPHGSEGGRRLAREGAMPKRQYAHASGGRGAGEGRLDTRPAVKKTRNVETRIRGESEGLIPRQKRGQGFRGRVGPLHIDDEL
uniref:Protein PRRC2A-like n=1 Tax=Petromyzon marinus TaxID=7757 RepID=A0AAJ7WLW2_PETMA|nr:protein PRRC2A-like [Petromyzon marinus]